MTTPTLLAGLRLRLVCGPILGWPHPLPSLQLTVNLDTNRRRSGVHKFIFSDYSGGQITSVKTLEADISIIKASKKHFPILVPNEGSLVSETVPGYVSHNISLHVVSEGVAELKSLTLIRL